MLNGSVFQESVWCSFTSTNEEKVLIGRIYKSGVGVGGVKLFHCIVCTGVYGILCA